MSNFVNRKEDFLWFNKRVRATNQYNKLFYICGRSGIGKSSFTDKLMKENLSQYSCISIRFSSVRNIANSDGFFLQTIVSEMSKYADKTNRFDSFKYFMINFKTIAESIRQYFLNVNGTLDNIMSYGLNDKVLKAFTDYLIYIFNNNKIVLNIESIEMIDEYSIKVLKRLLNETFNNIFLLEFTYDDSNDHFKYKLWDNLAGENPGDNYRYDLKSLDFEECIKIHNNKNTKKLTNYDMIEKVYHSSKGNLYKIIHFDAEEHFNNEIYEINNYNTTLIKLNGLDTVSIYCLVVIAMHGHSI